MLGQVGAKLVARIGSCMATSSEFLEVLHNDRTFTSGSE